MVEVSPARPSDLATTAALHRQHLDAGLFPQLGARFMLHYHESFLASPFADALVARTDGEPVGFLLGTTDNHAHYRWVAHRRGVLLACSGAAAMARRPHIAWTFATTRLGRYANWAYRQVAGSLRNGRADVPATSAPSPRLAVLAHIAVADHARHSGLGGQLVSAFLERAAGRGSTEARLITSTSGAGVAFYEGLGWERIRDRRARDGSPVREFRWRLDGSRGSKPR